MSEQTTQNIGQQLNKRINWLQSPDVLHFIQSNLQVDLNKLLLNPPAHLKENISLIVDQLLSRRKAKDKLPNWVSNEQLIMPPPLSVEQSSSQIAADYKRQLLSGNHLVDLTGGMGIDTLTLAEHFSQTTYVEQDEWLCDVFRHNAHILGRQIGIVHTTAEYFLAAFESKAHFFIDPARRDEQQKKVFHFENCSPDIIVLLPLFRKKAQKVLVKAAPMIDITLGINHLPQVSEVHVVSVKNEVKEVLFLLDFETNESEPFIHCVNLTSDQRGFKFTLNDERQQEVKPGKIDQYLYDPNASIRKAGAFKSIATAYQLNKLAVNTHLYTSETLIENFPGRIFEVIEASCSKKEIARLIPERKANVITKNYPMKPEALKKKLQLKDGGEWFVIGYRDSNDQPELCLARQVGLSSF